MGLQSLFNGSGVVKTWDSEGGPVEEGFNATLVTDDPFAIKDITSLVNGFEFYSNMFDNQVCYGYLSVADTLNNINDYVESNSSFLVLTINGEKSVHKVLKCRKLMTNVPNTYDNVYIFEYMSIIGFQFLRKRYVKPVNSKEIPTMSMMMRKALEADSNILEKLTVSSQILIYLSELPPFSGDFDGYPKCISVHDTVGVTTIKQPRFTSRVEQLDFLCQYAIPYGHNDITNTINDFWVWQQSPNGIICDSITSLFNQTPKVKMSYGGLPRDSVLSTEIHCETFDLKRVPNSETAKVNVKITIDPTSRSMSMYKNNVGTIKDKNSLSLNKTVAKTSPNNYEENVSYSVGSNTDVNRSIDYMNDNGENINDFGLDSKRLEMRNDFFHGLMSFYATISINRNVWDLNVGNVIDLSIYKKPTDNYSSEELDKSLSGKWLVIEKAIHMRSNMTFSSVYGIVKDSING